MPLVMRIPPMPGVAQDLVGTVGVFVQLVYSGPESEAARSIAPFRELGPVLLNSVAEMSYPEVYPPASDTRWGIASEAMFIDRLDREIADIVIRRIGSASAAEAMVQLRVFGGAFARSADGSTAFGHRSRPALMWLLTPYQDLEHGAEHHAWTRSFRDELVSRSRGTYLNFLESPDPADRRRLRPRDARAAGVDQADVRPGRSLPSGREHRTGDQHVTRTADRATPGRTTTRRASERRQRIDA